MLELKGITKDYYVGGKPVRALNGISLAFRKNEMVSILGQSGCGKTTLLNIIGGLDRYTDGDLIISGRSTKYFKASDWDAYRNQKIGFVFQSYNLIPHLTVLGNVELALTLSGIKKGERRQRAIDALKMVGLEKEIKKRPNQMSGGQMQRVAIARAIVNNPDIILADEPTGALDSNTSVDVLNILKDISRERLVIMVTHNRALAEQYSTRIISMLDGVATDDTAPVPFASDEENERQAAELSNGDNNDAVNAQSQQSKEQIAAAAQEQKRLAKQKKKEQRAITKANRASLRRTSMSLFTAFGLSWRNLITKKGRTIATSIAGSIGVIGVALVLALSNGFNNYIEDMQTSMLAHYPVTVTQTTMNIDAMMSAMESGNEPKLQQFPDGKKIIIKSATTRAVYKFNRITQEYLDRVEKMPSGLALGVTRDYARTPTVITKNSNKMSTGGYDSISTVNNSLNSMIGTNSSGFQQLLDNSDYIKSQYDVLDGKYPTAKDELAVIIGTDNSITDRALRELGLKIPENRDNATFADIMGQELKLVFNNQWFKYDSVTGIYKAFDSSDKSPSEWQALYNDEHNLTLKVVGIMRLKDSASLAMYSNGIVYTSALNKALLADCKNSDVVQAQNASPDRCVSNAVKLQFGSSGKIETAGRTYDDIYKEIRPIAAALGMSNLSKADLKLMAEQAVGASDIPVGLNFYPVTFAKKTDMINYLNGYNSGKPSDDAVIPLDAASVVTAAISDLIDIISYVLLAFAAISLLVSSVMISIITYASVVERTKEIGVLRAVGARKTDIMRVFIAETVIIGFVAGVIGVLVTLILSFPLSSLFIGISDGVVTTSLVSVAWWHAVLLIGISVLLTLLAGTLPARSASKRDPVVALRAE